MTLCRSYFYSYANYDISYGLSDLWKFNYHFEKVVSLLYTFFFSVMCLKFMTG